MFLSLRAQPEKRIHKKGICMIYLINNQHFHCEVSKSLQTCCYPLVSKSCPTFLWPHGPCQTPLSMGFPRQQYWSMLPLPPPGDLPHPGTEPGSPALQADFFATEPLGKIHFKKVPFGHFRMSKTWTQTGPSVTFLWVSDWYHSSDCSWQKKTSKTSWNCPLPYSQYLIHHQVLSISSLKHLSNHLLLCSIITILKGLSFHAVSRDCLHQLSF